MIRSVPENLGALIPLRDAMEVLREIRTTSDLLHWAGAAITQLGFDRAIVSSVENGAWLPVRVIDPRDQRWAEEILQAGRTPGRTFDSRLVETQLLRTRKGMVVLDAQRRHDVHREMARAARTESYVVVPIIGDMSVIGFLHADCYYQQREPTALDETVLALFAEGLGHALRRIVSTERLGDVRCELNRLNETIKGEQTSLTGHLVPAVGHRAFMVTHAQPEPRDLLNLTRREIDVLRLMATGLTNARISRRLVISEGTVKSHVKHILRKVHAENRAEAVAKWLAAEHEMARSGPQAR